MKHQLSAEGKSFIQGYENCILTAKRDGKYNSIGYGHNGPDVTDGMKITRAQALKLFDEDVAKFEKTVNTLVQTELTQSQFDALVSFAYNVGAYGFQVSNLLIHLNRGERSEAADQFLRWNRSDGEVNEGLVKRRAAERALFLGLELKDAIKAGEDAHEAYRQGL